MMHTIASQGSTICDSLLGRKLHTFKGFYEGCRLKEVTAAVMRSSSYVYYYVYYWAYWHARDYAWYDDCVDVVYALSLPSRLL